jgi:Eco57I restriction-modification methylase
VDPVHLLASISALHDLDRLVAALGHTPCWEELAADVLPVPVAEAAVVGRASGFAWLAARSTQPLLCARRLAARCSAAGRITGVLALDPAARRLAIGLTVDRPAAMEVDLDSPEPEARERLRRLALIRADGLLFAARGVEVIAGEAIGLRFFRAFARVADRMAGDLTGSPRPADRRDLALIQLTRVLFLYFVQCRGWLDGRPDFLRRQVDDRLARRRGLHRDLFRPLFFGTLNRPPGRRGRARAFGRIPFLNGGLFEPHPLERRWRGEVPNLAWREAFDSLFERFHFTVGEGGAALGTIAPDMLGRVFEGLMAPESRHASGAFYTPARLVHEVLDSALAALLAERLHLAPDQARAALAEPTAEVRTLVRRITVLDPACGSGAFLVGALDRLAQLRGPGGCPGALRRSILARNLFGVDLHPMAVRLTELRLWLAVLAAEPAVEPDRVEPLPNLDGVVRQGDSLLEPGRALGRLGQRPGADALVLGDLRAALVRASGEVKRDAIRALRRAEVRLFRRGVDQAVARLDAKILECLTSARAPTLFGGRRGLDRPLKLALARARQDRTGLRRLRRQLERDGEVGWFSYDAQWADVLARGGFDIVVGNPPWVRAEQLSRSMRAALGERYRWWRARGAGFRHQPDLALAFVERGLELLAPGGVLGFLLPAKVATADYGRIARSSLAGGFTIHAVADLSAFAASFDATVYPMALVVSRAAPLPGHLVSPTLGAVSVTGPPQARLSGAPWILRSTPLLDALEALRQGHPPLGEQLTPQLGMKTGANPAFLDPPAGVEPGLIRWALRGRDVDPFAIEPRCRLLWTHDRDGRPLPRLPAGAMGHLRHHEALLRARVDYARGPWWTLFRTEAAVASHRVVWPDLARRLAAAPLVGPTARSIIPLNSCYVIALASDEQAMALSAWLNATWLRAAARAEADVAMSGFARFRARVVAALPLPAGTLADPLLAEFGRQGLSARLHQEDLDDHVARSLTLTPAARAALLELPGLHSPTTRRRTAQARG